MADQELGRSPKAVSCHVDPRSDGAQCQHSDTIPHVVKAPSRWFFGKHETNQFDGKRAVPRGYVYRRPDRNYLEKTFYSDRTLDEVDHEKETECIENIPIVTSMVGSPTERKTS